MWHLTARKISVSLSFLKWNHSWNEMIFFILSYLWINSANINTEILWKTILYLIQFKDEKLIEILQLLLYNKKKTIFYYYHYVIVNVHL